MTRFRGLKQSLPVLKHPNSEVDKPIGDKTSCSELETIHTRKNFLKLGFVEDLKKKCNEGKDKFACEKVGVVKFILCISCLTYVSINAIIVN